jgi:hypothetical protein
MTNMISARLPDDEVLKSDALGRVKIDRSSREALLDEFEQSGASGPAFAVATLSSGALRIAYRKPIRYPPIRPAPASETRKYD